jgi:hypothetical protein
MARSERGRSASKSPTSIRVSRFARYRGSKCLFERNHRELLSLEIEAGDPRTFRTAIGSIDAFGHTVKIEVLGLKFESVVFFFADERINENLPGRSGRLDRIRLKKC